MKNMKKYWKQIAIGLSVVFLAIAGYLVYAFEVKEYDTADEEVDKITKDEIEIDLPDDTTITVDEEGDVTTEETDKEEDEEKDEEPTEETTEEKSTDTASTDSASTVAAVEKSTNSTTPAKASSSNGSSNNTNSSYNNNNNSKGSDRVTVSHIKDRYDTSLNRLEDTANDRLDSLVSRAKTEYMNDDSVSYARYYNKYASAAKELENRADAAFYAIVAVMARDLQANGLAASHTDSVINEYENKKKQRKNALMKKVAGL